MLLQIMPEQVIQFKEVIRAAVDASLPETPGESANKFNNILQKLLIGEMTGWIIYRREEDKKKTIGFMITTIEYNDITETKSLLIYCIHVYGMSNDKDWVEGFRALEAYGVKHKCTSLTGYMLRDSFLKRAYQFGAEVRQLVIVPFSGGAYARLQ